MKIVLILNKIILIIQIIIINIITNICFNYKIKWFINAFNIRISVYS